MRLPHRLLATIAFAVFAAALVAQSPTDWQVAADLPGVDMSSLTADQKTEVLKILRAQGCSCGCAMQLAECRIKDPACSFSLGLAQLAVKNVRDGKSEAEVIAALAASPLSKGPAKRPILEAPVTIATDGAPAKGPDHPRITLVEFSDFECPYCRAAVGQVDELMKLYPNDIRLIYKQYPLPTHPHARLAAAAALAANEQGKFWQMHDRLFANSRHLNEAGILALAKDLGLDMNRFSADMKSEKIQAEINKDMKDGDQAGVYGTPAFFINGKLYNGPMEVAAVKPLIEAELRPVTAAK